MTRKMIMGALLALVGLFGAPEAKAGPSFEVGYTTFAVTGVICSTGTRVQINATKPGNMSGVVVGYRVQNQDATSAVWLGGISVSTHATNGAATPLSTLGEKLTAGANAPWALGKDPNRASVPLVPIYCLAADAATSGALLSVLWFGY